MRLIDVSCNNCGAPLQVPNDAKFATCNYCSSRLAVRRTGSATFTEKLEEISQRTERIEKELGELQYRQQLEELDRSWQRERESYMIADKYGNRRVPTVAGSVIGGLVVVAFGIFWTAMAGRAGGGGFALFGVIFIVFGLGVSIYSYAKAQDYLSAQRRYRRRRTALSRRRYR